MNRRRQPRQLREDRAPMVRCDYCRTPHAASWMTLIKGTAACKECLETARYRTRFYPDDDHRTVSAALVEQFWERREAAALEE